MNTEARERTASKLLIVTSVVWLHQWFPALVVAGFVLWVVLSKRLEGGLGRDVVRVWRRAWPPRTFVLLPVLLASTVAYGLAGVPVTAKVMPVALNVLALSILALGNWWRVVPDFEVPWRVHGATDRTRPAARHLIPVAHRTAK